MLMWSNFAPWVTAESTMLKQPDQWWLILFDFVWIIFSLFLHVMFWTSGKTCVMPREQDVIDSWSFVLQANEFLTHALMLLGVFPRCVQSPVAWEGDVFPLSRLHARAIETFSPIRSPLRRPNAFTLKLKAGVVSNMKITFGPLSAEM